MKFRGERNQNLELSFGFENFSLHSRETVEAVFNVKLLVHSFLTRNLAFEL